MIYQGANIVTRSLEMDQPVVFVSANYRLNAFGSLASQEIKLLSQSDDHPNVVRYYRHEKDKDFLYVFFVSLDITSSLTLNTVISLSSAARPVCGTFTARECQ